MRRNLLGVAVAMGLVLFCGTAVWKRLAGYPKVTPEFTHFERALISADEMRPGIQRLQRAKAWFESQPYGVIEKEWTQHKEPFEIDQIRAELQQQWPGIDINEKDFPSLKPISKSTYRWVFDQNRVALDQISPTDHLRIVWDGEMAKQVYRRQGEPDAYMIKPTSCDVIGFAFSGPCNVVPWWLQQCGPKFDYELRLDENRNCFSDGWLVHQGEECFMFTDAPGTRYIIGTTDMRLRGTRHGNSVRLFSDFEAVAPGIHWPMRCDVKNYRVPPGGSHRDHPRILAWTGESITRFDFETPPTDDEFVIEFEKGGRVVDARYDPLMVYTHDPDRSEAEWDAIWKEHAKDKEQNDKMRQKQQALVGKEAPDFGEGEWVNCQPKSIVDFRGRPLEIGFTSLACAPCEDMLAQFAAAIDRDSPVQHLVVFAAEDDLEKVEAKVAKFNLKCPIFVGAPNPQGPWSGPFEDYEVSAIPTVIRVDGTGKITKHRVGMFEELLAT
ncbi:TlpA family protein disulfide reductase [Novipirellula artificiosorum]|uniref:Thiol-disulfide oxidoreductase n=1 Tax=Novipirellula artificiosorum TaxID=2528016 RepID=A0A5C6E1D4_9BACT|nr:hypothetical protein [Novipirellula artificiosorum]TWU42690.1 thiol-disulfide oxidoreductase [Novipirellula artificiosorum]